MDFWAERLPRLVSPRLEEEEELGLAWLVGKEEEEEASCRRGVKRLRSLERSGWKKKKKKRRMSGEQEEKRKFLSAQILMGERIVKDGWGCDVMWYMADTDRTTHMCGSTYVYGMELKMRRQIFRVDASFHSQALDYKTTLSVAVSIILYRYVR